MGQSQDQADHSRPVCDQSVLHLRDIRRVLESYVSRDLVFLQHWMDDDML